VSARGAALLHSAQWRELAGAGFHSLLKNMTIRAVLSVVLAIAPAFGLSAQDATSPPAAPKTEQTQNAPDPATPPPAAAPAAIPPATAPDPAKLAETKPAPGAKAPGALPVDDKTYVIGPEDNLAISVWEQPQLSTACVVRSDGMITMPLINEIKAQGLTPLALGKALADALSEHLNNPIVTVSVTGAHSKKYYIYGQMKSPGAHDLVVPTTVMEAIMSAGGFADFANQKDITIVRGAKRFKFNFKDVMAGKRLEQNIYLESGDMIVVK